MRTVAILSNKTCRLAILVLAGAAVCAAFGGEPPGIGKDEAFKQEVKRIADALRYKDGLRISQITWNGQQASSAILWRTTWELKAVPQSTALEGKWLTDAMKLPEAERLKTMNRFDDHIQIWGVELPAKGEPGDKTGLVAADEPHRQHRELFYLGRDKNFAWYGFMPIYEFAQVEQQLSLKGDDVLPALIRGEAVKDLGSCTATSCGGWLTREGARALKAVDEAIAARAPQRSQLVWHVGYSQDKAVTRWLVGLLTSTDADVAGTARYTLLAAPRAEAGSLYVKWLAEGAGQREVKKELEACRKLKLKEAAPLLPKVLAAPASVQDYRLALEMSHEFAGKPPMPADVFAAEERIWKFGFGSGNPVFDQRQVDEAVDAVLAAASAEDAAAIGMTLAIATSKGDTSAVRRAGVQILRRVPGGEGKRLVRLLARTNRVDWQTAEIREAAEAVDSR